jgi:HAE1 family hydrophobic/amphiphilic exporter-1
VADVARVKLDFDDPTVVVRHEGIPTIVLNAVREPGTNVLVVMEDIKEAVAELNDGILKDHHLTVDQVYDETGYIYSAINLVRQNIFVGGTLAVIMLLIFLRNIASTVIIAVAIPISAVGTFLVMTLLGRNINVVSLAGLSFAIGMVVDNSIVVFENIFRHREMGKSRVKAAYEGTVEVWGAVLASTLTTVAVFLPIVFVEEEAGQLFRDIAIAISSAVVLSLTVSMTVIPTMSSRILGKVHRDRPTANAYKPLLGGARIFVNSIANFVDWMCRRVSTRIAVALTLVTVAVSLALFLMPKTEYLPEGNREMLFGILLPPPGYNLEELNEIGKSIEADILPLIPHNGARSERAEELNLPPVSNFFYVAWGQQAFMGIVSAVQERTGQLLPYAYKVLGKIPGMYPFVTQASLFQRGASQGRSIEVYIEGPDLEQLIAMAKQMFGMIYQLLPGSQVRPIPGLELGNPEMRVFPNRDRLTRLNMTTADLGMIVNAVVDGAKASDYRLFGDEIDLVVKNREGRLERTQDLANIPIIGPGGEKVTLGSVAEIRLEEGPAQINHMNSQRAITLVVKPPMDIPLEEAMDTIRDKVVTPIKAGPNFTSLYNIELGGTADDLTRTRQALQWNFILAVVISYLLMSALFENFFYPFIIMFSVPLAAAGGFVGLALVNVYLHFLSGEIQFFDIITMLGFVILVGIVVNNAILIVHQSLNNIRFHNMPHRRAIVESVRSRVRPIYMSSITTVSAMLPLVLAPGAGSEFYRGLGSVVVGGLLVSTVFTIFLIPALLSLAFDVAAKIKKRPAD